MVINMYLRILTRDLKRKKTMNIILLIFIIMAAAFISCSMNNLLVITSAMDSYFTKAGLKDFMILTIQDENNDKAIADFLDTNHNVTSWSKDETLYIVQSEVKRTDGKKFTMGGTALVTGCHISQQKFFDRNNKEITKVNDGELYIPIKLMDDNNLKVGDKIIVSNGGVQMEFKVMGNCKDAFLGSAMMGASRFIISDNDYARLHTGKDIKIGYIYSVNSSEIKTLKSDFNKLGANVLVACDKLLISFSYVMDMIIAGILLVVSICLILISFVILRFTIVFTLNEEFREIGIMKAIGIKNRKVRGLYIVKYLAISVIGAFVGFIISIPLTNLFLKQVSRNVVIASGAGMFLINFSCSALIVAVVLMFCYFCTHQVNRFTPIDAIRNGSNGERFKRKGLLKLGRSRLSPAVFLALNDILSGLRKYSVLIITFTLGTILVILPINTINTLKSDKLITWFGMAESDVYMVNENDMADFRTNGRDYAKEHLKEIEETLKQNGIPAKVFCESLFKFKIAYKDLSYNSFSEQSNGIGTDQYDYTKGQPPKYANEVALTKITADKIGANIGDTVRIKTGDKEEEFIVTAFYQSMNNLGEGMRFTEDAKLDYSMLIGTFAVQIKFTDQTSVNEFKDRMEKIRELFPRYDVKDAQEYLSWVMGNVAGQLEGMKKLVLMVVLMINLLVAVLMEKTFLTKERGEIGMLKSIGFSNITIIKWQAARIGIVLLISTILGALLSNPAANVTTAKGFQMMGASHIDFVIKPLEAYLMYPLIIFAVTMTASILTALQARRITAHETNNIE